MSVGQSRLLRGAWLLMREAARHVLRHPVVGVAVAARGEDGRWLLIRRRDTGGWALPGGTLEWGERVSQAARRELREEAGVELLEEPVLCGVYSDPERDYRFHAVTVLVSARVSAIQSEPNNHLEIAEVGWFHAAELPGTLSLGMTDLLRDAGADRHVLE